MSTKNLLGISLLILATFGLLQVGFAQTPPKTMVVAITAEPDPTDLNPIRMITLYWMAETYADLVEWDQNGKTEPGLAQSWTVSPDGLTYTFTLKDGLKWSDGQPLTSDDVAFNFKIFTEQSTFFYYQWASIQVPDSNTVTGFALKPGAIETPDPKTVVFHLSAPSATFFIYAGGWPILPKHYYEGMDLSKNNPDVTTMVGSGAFIPHERVPGDKIVYVANPYYYGGKPFLDQVIFKVYRDPTGAEIGLQSGEANLMLNVPAQDVPALQANSNLVIGTEQPQLNTYIILNHHPKLIDGSDNPVSNLLVRKAIVLSLDLPSILNASFGTFYKDANQIQVPNMYYLGKAVWNSTIPMPEWPYDPTTAAQLLDQAGYPAGAGGRRFTLNLVIAGQPGASIIKMLQLIQSSLKTVGINLELVLMERSAGRQRIFRGAVPKDWNMALGGISSSPDPDVNAFYMVSTLADNGAAGGFNAGGYYNPLVNQLTVLGENTTDVDQRVAIYQRISGIAHEEVAVLELYYPVEIHAWNKMYQGFVLGLGNPPHDYWGIIKHQSLAKVNIVEVTTTTSTEAMPVGPDYTTISAVVIGLVAIVGVAAYMIGRRGKKAN
jgi:peptide/nickel transport system substrate-binding protein